jgi:HEAT repeat protein
MAQWEQLVREALQKLRNADVTVRSDAALTLGKLEDPDAPEALVGEAIEALSRDLDDPDEYVRKSAVHALGRLRTRDARALEGIRFALGDRSEQVVQESVGQALAAVDKGAVEGLIRVLGRRERTLQAAAMQALIKIGPDAVRPLLETFKDRNLRRRVHQQVLRVIVDMKARAVEPLLAALDDENFHVRGYAIALLGKLGDERTIAPLIRLFVDDARVQETVVNQLPRLEERAVLEGGHADRDVHLPREVAEALHALIKEAAAARRAEIEANLIAAAEGQNAKVRKFALRALFEIAGARAKEKLLALLSDPDVDMQRLAIKLLGRLHDRTVIDALLEVVKRGGSQVEETVWNTVKVLTDLREYEALRSRVAREKAGVSATPTVRVYKQAKDQSADWWRDQD